jgi:hypothetical protein
MAKTIAVIMGAIFIVMGLTGFAFNNLLGAHLTPMHNIIHLVSGAASLYFGLKGSRFAAKTFCLVFGISYLGLGVIGYWLGYNHMATTLPGTYADNGYNQNMFRAISGVFELGTMDHIIHLVIGSVYIIAAVLTRTRRNAQEFLEGNPN